MKSLLRLGANGHDISFRNAPSYFANKHSFDLDEFYFGTSTYREETISCQLPWMMVQKRISDGKDNYS